MTEIYVLDTETTGLVGAPHDLVLDIGIAKADTEKRTVEEVYSSVVGYDVSAWSERLRDSWIFSNSDLTLEMVGNAVPVGKVTEQVREVLRGKIVTAYNVAYDFGKFLNWEPWNLRKDVVLHGDVMLSAAQCLKIPGYYGQYKWPRLEEAYGELVPGDPAGISDGQDHRALSDAVVASHVLLALDRLGYWR